MATTGSDGVRIGAETPHPSHPSAHTSAYRASNRKQGNVAYAEYKNAASRPLPPQDTHSSRAG
ncbi:hypothetical protein E5D57_010543 [Metarhizium anisopliae]|nr:hypothetical protein E5D57_010543 [Metarhizium anisopliae]